MKTLREVLLEKHQAAEPRLDVIREQVVTGLATERGASATARSQRAADDWQSDAPGWRQFMWPLRWHLAGLSATWLVALLLNLDPTSAPAPGVTRQDTPSPQQLVAALRENQRQIRELIAAPAAEPAPEPPEFKPSPRSQVQSLPTAAI
jgi:hypothetical protein